MKLTFEQRQRIEPLIEQMQDDPEAVATRLILLEDSINNAPFFGIYHAAWWACCDAHNIDWTEFEARRFEKAAKESPYNPKRPESTEGRGE